MSDARPDMKEVLALVAEGGRLSVDQTRRAFDIMMSGDATPSQTGALLMALRLRGETVEELTGAVMTMREKMTRVESPATAIDVVGTGGDRSGTYNVSTAAAIAVAGCGVPVAKHGNRAASLQIGRCGRVGGARRRYRVRFPADEEGPVGGGHVLHVRPAPPRRDAPRGRRPRRNGHPARSSTCWDPLSNPAGVDKHLVGRLFTGMGGAARAGARESRLPARLGGPRRRRTGRDHHHRPHPRRRTEGRRDSGRSKSRRRTPACRARTARR